MWILLRNRRPSAEDPFEDYTGGEIAKDWESNLHSDTKVILIYTTIFNTPKWHNMEGSKLHTFFDDMKCPTRNCLVTYNRKRLPRVDAAIFHAMDVERHRYDRYSAELLKELRKKVPEKQKWVFLSHENPLFEPYFYEPYDGVFNWTATFRVNSDVFIPYAWYKRDDSLKVPERNYAAGKKGLVAWAVSHCGIMRQDYAQELQHYLNLTVYGKCRHFFNNQRNCKHFNVDCDKELSSYKFFLAFENDFCEDYVTEKYWERIDQETVPVVMGATYDKRLVIPGSYIDASEFDSIKSLADYLLYLDSNDTAYNQYFKWKSHYTTDILPLYDIYCKLCLNLHSQTFKKHSQVKLSEFYNLKTKCEEPHKHKVEKFVKQIEQSRRDREYFFSFIPRHVHNLVAKIKRKLE